MSPTIASLPLRPCLSLSVFPLSSSLFFIVMPESAVYLAITPELALHNKFVSWQQLAAETSGPGLARSSCAHIGSRDLNTWPRAQREGGRGDIKNPDPKHKNGSVLHRCQRNVILTLILSLPEKAASWDPGTNTHACRHAEALAHIGIFNKPGSGPFQRTYTTVSLLGPLFTTLWSPVYWLFMFFLVEGQELIDRNSGKIYRVTSLRRSTHLLWLLNFAFKISTAEALFMKVSRANKYLCKTRSNPEPWFIKAHSHQHRHITMMSPIPRHISY